MSRRSRTSWWRLSALLPTALHRYDWRYVVGFVHPASGRTVWHLATTVNIELFSAEHLWPLTNTVLANQHFASIEALEDAQAERCVVLQARPDLIRQGATLFHWWPKRIGKRQGPRAASPNVQGPH